MYRFFLYLVAVFYLACVSTNQIPTIPPPVAPMPEDQDQDHVPAGEDCDDNDPTSYPNAPEMCDGVDNNCNGETDETYFSTYGISLFDACAVISDEGCRSEGVWVCNSDRWGINCSAIPFPKQDYETCNNIDDDCDGETDEDWPEKNGLCWVLVQGCFVFGHWECEDYSETAFCTAENVWEVDDNCDPK